MGKDRPPDQIGDFNWLYCLGCIDAKDKILDLSKVSKVGSEFVEEKGIDD